MQTSNDARPRVVLLHNFLTPYRAPLFAELARRFDFEAWILSDVRMIREWSGAAPGESFRVRFLPHISLPLGSRYNTLYVNHTLGHELDVARPEVLICCGWDSPSAFWAARWARRNGTPFILWSGSTRAEAAWYRSASRSLVCWLVRQADAWIAYGSRAADYLESLGADPARTTRAFNTVDIERFARESALSPEARAALKQRLGVDTEYVIFFCGNLLRLKGLDDLLPAFAEFARERGDVSLLLAGSGPEEGRLRALSGKLGIAERVRFAGFVAPEDLPPYYGIADLCALPSRREVWGLVINEAFASGVPVIASERAGAVDDLLRDGENGYVVPAGNPRAILEVLRRFFAPDTDRRAMGRAARETIASFTLARMADAFEQAARFALGRRA